MFLEVKRSPMLFMQHKGMGGNYITPVTSSLRINLGFVAEISVYTIKESKTRQTLDGNEIIVPDGTHVIHLEMSYTYSTHKHHVGTPSEHSINERYYYKLVFMPGAEAEFTRIKSIIDRATAE